MFFKCLFIEFELTPVVAFITLHCHDSVKLLGVFPYPKNKRIEPEGF